MEFDYYLTDGEREIEVVFDSKIKMGKLAEVLKNDFKGFKLKCDTFYQDK